MGFDAMRILNNDNAVLAFSVGLLSEKYVKCVYDVFTCRLEITFLNRDHTLIFYGR